MIALRKPMRLCLSTPPAFSHVWSRDQDGRYTAASPGGQVTLACGALQPLPDDLSAWRSSVLAADLRPAAELELGGVVDQRSETSGGRSRLGATQPAAETKRKQQHGDGNSARRVR